HTAPPGADPELHDRTAGRDRLLHVEADVLDNAPAPRVVDGGDRIVGAVHVSILLDRCRPMFSSKADPHPSSTDAGLQSAARTSPTPRTPGARLPTTRSVVATTPSCSSCSAPTRMT